MTSLDRLMEYLAACAFLCAGLVEIYSYRRRPKALGADSRDLPLGLPYGLIAALGVREIVAALVMVAAPGFWPQPQVVPMAAVGLAGLAAFAVVYRLGRRESIEPQVVLFLLAIFVLVGRMV